MKIQQTKQTLKIGGFLTGIATNDNSKNIILVSGSSGEVTVVQIEPFKILKIVKVFHEYATSLIPFNNGICVGSKNGNFAYLNNKDEIIFKLKIHADAISSIIETQEYIVTTGYDGLILFMNKQTFDIKKKLNLETPIMKATQYDTSIYTSGNPSYCVNGLTFEVKPLKRFDFFEKFSRRLYGCSDERGLSCISTGSNSYIPCNFIIPMKDRMLIFSDQCIGQLFHKDHMQWKCHKTKQIDIGTTIIGGCIINQQIILGDDQGMVYKIPYKYSPRESSRKKNQTNQIN